MNNALSKKPLKFYTIKINEIIVTQKIISISTGHMSAQILS